jgi:sporulation protein YlmC with PRC-barrel domain
VATLAMAQQRQQEEQQAGRSGPSGTQASGQQSGQQQSGQQHQFCAASKLGQMSVRTQDGQQIGMVKDLLINTQTGQIGYVAISASGQTGATSQPGQATQPGAQGAAQGQLFVVPWEAIQQPQQQAATQPGQPQQPQHLTVKLEKDRLKEAPRFSQQQLTSPQGSAQWMAKVNEFYDVGATRVARPEQDRPGQTQQPNQQPNQQKQQQNRQQNQQQNRGTQR